MSDGKRKYGMFGFGFGLGLDFENWVRVRRAGRV
jgi:hypothetical protein